MFYPIDAIELQSIDGAEPGAVMLHRINGITYPILVADINETRVYMSLGGQFPFSIDVMTNTASRWLRSKQPVVFKVDMDSAYSPQVESERRGDMFISSGERGIIGIWHGAIARIGLDGMDLPEPNWSEYVGFRRWKVVLPLDSESELTIFEWPAQVA